MGGLEEEDKWGEDAMCRMECCVTNRTQTDDVTPLIMGKTRTTRYCRDSRCEEVDSGMCCRCTARRICETEQLEGERWRYDSVHGAVGESRYRREAGREEVDDCVNNVKDHFVPLDESAKGRATCTNPPTVIRCC